MNPIVLPDPADIIGGQFRGRISFADGCSPIYQAICRVLFRQAPAQMLGIDAGRIMTGLRLMERHVVMGRPRGAREGEGYMSDTLESPVKPYPAIAVSVPIERPFNATVTGIGDSIP